MLHSIFNFVLNIEFGRWWVILMAPSSVGYGWTEDSEWEKKIKSLNSNY